MKLFNFLYFRFPNTAHGSCPVARMRVRAMMVLGSGLIALGVLSACTSSDGGQSGGGNQNVHPLCVEDSREVIDGSAIPDGFAVSPQEEIDLYTRQFEGELIAADEEVVGVVSLSLQRADESIELVRRSPNTAPEPAEGPTVLIGGVLTDPCEDYYDIHFSYAFSLSDEGEELVSVSGDRSFLITASRRLEAFITRDLSDVGGSFEPALVAEGYENITLQLSLASDLPESELGPEVGLKGMLNWQGERVDGDGPDGLAESKVETTGRFEVPFEEEE